MTLFKFTFTIILCSLFWACNNRVNSSEKDSKAEAFRPVYHFTPDSMWMNDPNGLVYYDGEYHLFYQFYPDSTVWGPMHWGHAVSRDMVHWQDLPIALYPDSLGLIFSGSAVIDWENTSGFGINGKPPMIAIFTYHNMAGEKAGKTDFQTQGLAFSNDKGRTWTKYEGNPIIKNPGTKDFRDPKVIWHEQSKQWVLVLAAKDKVKFYTSADLKSWTFASDFGIPNDERLWECPDLFPLKTIEGSETKWILITSMQTGAPNGGTGTSYWVGDFDGKYFKCKDAKSDQQWLDDGKDNYAFVTWSDVPKTDGRRMGIGWMSNWQYAQKVPSVKWRSAMTLPRELSLSKDKNGYQLLSAPVKEMKNAEGPTTKINPDHDKPQIALPDESTAHISIKIKNPKADQVYLVFSNANGNRIEAGFDADQNKYFIDRTSSGIVDFSQDFSGRHYSSSTYHSDTLTMDVYLDHSSIELFAEQGKCAMTDIFFATVPLNKIMLKSTSFLTLYNGSIAKISLAHTSNK